VYFEIETCQIVKYAHHKASIIGQNLLTAPGIRYYGFNSLYQNMRYQITFSISAIYNDTGNDEDF
jgi:hypothetical protein